MAGPQPATVCQNEQALQGGPRSGDAAWQGKRAALLPPLLGAGAQAAGGGAAQAGTHKGDEEGCGGAQHALLGDVLIPGLRQEGLAGGAHGAPEEVKGQQLLGDQLVGAGRVQPLACAAAASLLQGSSSSMLASQQAGGYR